MTIITRAVSEKKPIISELPLVTEDGVDLVTVEIPGRTSGREVLDRDLGLCGLSYCTTMYLFFTAMIVMTCGFVGGLYLYDEYGHQETQRFNGWCNVQYRNTKLQASSLQGVRIMDSLDNFDDISSPNDLTTALRERIEIGTEKENYEKIEVPDFADGRRGIFVHDFAFNQTGILDIKGKRCFIMPLDRNAVLLPDSLLDLLKKMWEGHYEVNMTVVKNMRVVLPPMKSTSSLSTHIAGECGRFPIYRLEKSVHGVFKRSINGGPQAKFSQFAGKVIQKLNIMNIEDVLQYEEQLKQNI